MSKLQRILLVLSNETSNMQGLINQIKQIRSHHQELICDLLYVVPRQPAMAFQVPEVVRIANEEEDLGRAVLKSVAEDLNIPAEHQWLSYGNPDRSAKKLAKKINCSRVYGHSANYLKRQEFWRLVKRRLRTNIRQIPTFSR